MTLCSLRNFGPGMQHSRHLRLVFALLALGAVTACAPPWPQAHRIDIQQGNVVTQDMLAQLEPGMDQRDVRFIMGTPMLNSPFHADRWDYIYTLRPSEGEREHLHVALFFEEGRLARIGGDSVEIAADGSVTLTEEIDFVIEDWDADPDTTPLDEPLGPGPGPDTDPEGPGGPGGPGGPPPGFQE